MKVVHPKPVPPLRIFLFNLYVKTEKPGKHGLPGFCCLFTGYRATILLNNWLSRKFRHSMRDCSPKWRE
jgi:hypothetical protein